MAGDVRSSGVLVLEGSLLAGSLQATPEASSIGEWDTDFSDVQSGPQYQQPLLPASSSAWQRPLTGAPQAMAVQSSGRHREKDMVNFTSEQRILKLEATLENLGRHQHQDLLRQHHDLLRQIEEQLKSNKDSYQDLLLEQIQMLSSEFCHQSEKILAFVQSLEQVKLDSGAQGVPSHPSVNGHAYTSSQKGFGEDEAEAPTMEERPSQLCADPLVAMETAYPVAKREVEFQEGFSHEDIALNVDKAAERDGSAMEKDYKEMWGRTNHFREGTLTKQSNDLLNILNKSASMCPELYGSQSNMSLDSEVLESDRLAPVDEDSYLKLRGTQAFLGRQEGPAAGDASGRNNLEAMRTQGTQSCDNGLTTGKSNMHFAKDLLFATANQHLDELTAAMQKHDLPEFYAKGKRWVSEPARENVLAKILDSQVFERIVSLIILLNTAFITYSTNYAVNHPDEQVTTLITLVETLFQLFYILELILKLVIHRCFFFTNKDFLWNILDCILAVGALYDLMMTQVIRTDLSKGSGTAGANNGFSLTFLRVLRLVRLTKVMRIFRVMRFFSELNVLLKVVSSSLRPLFWCTCMLIVFFYIFAVIFVHATAGCLADSRISEDTQKRMVENFGSVWKSMLNLMKATTGGGDWGQISEPLIDVGGYYYALFLFFIVFVILALLNILTGIFVDRAFKAVADDKDGMALEKLHADRAVVRDLCRLYCAMTGEDIDSPATISSDTFQAFMGSPVMRARLAVLDLEIWDSQQFFKMLCSISKSHNVDLQSFVTGCMQLRGQAKRLTLQAVHQDVQRIKKTFKDQARAHAARTHHSWESAQQSENITPRHVVF